MNLSQKKIVVFGPGVSGKAAAKFLANSKAQEVLIVGGGDPKNWGLEERFYRAPFRVLSQDDPKCSDELATSDLIILSPGIPREHAVLKEALKSGVDLWCEIELAYRLFNKPIIGVTGTNGKTTTVSLLGDLFKAYGLNTFIGGNIGIPFIEAIDSNEYDLAVLELSSFQLESLDKFHANLAAILNVFPNHGERYDDHEDYRLAKWNIMANQVKES